MENATIGTLPQLDRGLMQRLAQLRDDHGIATVLAPRGEAAEVEIRTALRHGGPPLSALADEAAGLADPRLPGAAHGLVATLSNGEVFRFALPCQVSTLVTVASRADVVPIARAFGEGRPVGIVDARLDRVRIAESADGHAHELEGRELSVSGDWTEYRGPARSSPVRATESSSQRERFEKRTRALRARALEDARLRIAELARARHWCALVVGGDAHATEALAFESSLPVLRVAEHLPAWESAGQLADHLAGELADARRRPATVLAATAHVRPRAFAVGPEAVRAAIDEGRATVVVIEEPLLAEAEEVARHALAHDLAVLFAERGPAGLEGVFCALHGAAGG